MSKKPAKRRLTTPQPAEPIPEGFLVRMRGLLGDEFAPFLATYDEAPRSGLRANTLKLAPGALQSLVPFSLAPLSWPPAAFLVSEEAQPGKHPYHAAGLYYLQDPSAMVAAALLAPAPGDRVLDLSAAPGGKATHLASLLAGSGTLVANEVHPQRVRDLAENLERWGARNVAVTNETPERLVRVFADFFDRILVDAPCSGEGMMRKSAAARLEWAPALIEGCALRQSTILDSAALMLRPGGLLVYATCTFAPEENEGTVARFLHAHSDFVLVEVPQHAGFAPGRPDWLPSADSSPDLARAVRLWPHAFPGEGQFIALLRRTRTHDDAGETEQVAVWEDRSSHAAAHGRAAAPARGQSAGREASGGPGVLRPAARALYLDFCSEHLSAVPAETDLAVTGSYLYHLPPGLPDLSGLRFLHPGWWLGSFKKDRFEPSHALALALRPGDVRRLLDLDPDGRDVRAYLRGESVTSGGDDGWVLVTTSGYALGWAKRVRGVLKSHYPRGLRRY